MNTAYELAKAEVGTVEWAKGSNPKVVAYYKDAGHPEIVDDATAWCAAFVGAMLRRSGQAGTGSLAARSYLQWGKAVDLDDAKPGDIVVFKRGNSSWQGHVAFYVSHDAGTIAVLGGNQRDAVTVAKYGRVSLLGIRRAALPSKPVAASKAPQVVINPTEPRHPTPSLFGDVLALLIDWIKNLLKGNRNVG